MIPEQEEFVALRRLLALKRHETPPPGYFQNFSAKIIIQIQAGDAAAARGRLGVFGGDWLQRFWSILETQPVIAGSCAVGLCAVLVSGFIASNESPAETQAGIAALPINRPTFGDPMTAQALATAPAASFSSTFGVVTPQGRPSLFDEVKRPQVVPVKFVGSGLR